MATCAICARYSDKFPTEKDVTDHMQEIHPNDPRTLERVTSLRVASYGSQDVGKIKPIDQPIPPRP